MDLIDARTLFNKAAGFIGRGGFDFTVNPYVGCSFGCTYCYSAFLPSNPRPVEDWGRWLQAKRNAVDLARRHAHKLAGKSVYMSTVTDPYMPAERSLLLTRGILEALLPHQPRLVIQTRGPLLVRDIDLFRQFRSIRVNVSIPTDSDEVRQAFEPKAPPLERRWGALADLAAEGVPLGVCVTPTLPILDPAAFAERIAGLKPAAVVMQHFHESRGGFGADTGDEARCLLPRWGWTEASYRAALGVMRGRLTVFEAEAGFFPPPAVMERTLFDG